MLASGRHFLRAALRESATIAVRSPAIGRRQLLAGYLPLKARQALAATRAQPRSGVARLSNLTIHYPNLDALVFMLEEIFIHEDYRFSTKAADPLVIDCGSNIGVSVLYFKTLYPNCRMRAFEPDPLSYRFLERNIAENHLDGISLSRCLLLGRPGKAQFTSVPGGLTAHVADARETGQAMEVDVQRLSGFVDEQVAFLKLDVQGAETAVISELADAGKLEYIDQMVIEYHHHLPNDEAFAHSPNSLRTLLEILEAHGFDYQIAAERGSRWTPGAFQDVLIFAFSERLSGL